MKILRNITIIITTAISFILIAACSTKESKQEAQKLIDRQVKIINEEKEVNHETFKKEIQVKDSIKNKPTEIIERKKPVGLKPVEKNELENSKQINEEPVKHYTVVDEQINIENQKEVDIEHKDSLIKPVTDKTVDTTGTIPIKKEIDRIEIEKLPAIQDSIKEKKIGLKPINQPKDKMVVKEETVKVRKESADEAKKVKEKQLEIEHKSERSVSGFTKLITVFVVIGLILFILLYSLGKRGRSKTKTS